MINVAVIGMRNISLLFDKDKNDNSKCLSHIKAIYSHNQFNLKYIIDIDQTNISLVKSFFPDVQYFNTHMNLTNKKDIDILVIATPTKTHFDILKDFKNSYIKLFFIEKPLFYKFNEYDDLDKLFKYKILINYTRRFDKSQNLNLKCNF